MKPLYVSIDIEVDGPCPGTHAMLSLGLAWRLSPGEEVQTWQRNLFPLTDCTDSRTMEWWMRRPEAWRAATENPMHPWKAMRDLDEVMSSLSGQGRLPVFVAYPAGFDFSFLYYYVRRYLDSPPWFTFSCVDIKTLAWSHLGDGYRHATKRNMPSRWFEGAPKHTHKASEDAHGQLILFENICKDLGLPS